MTQHVDWTAGDVCRALATALLAAAVALAQTKQAPGPDRPGAGTFSALSQDAEKARQADRLEEAVGLYEKALKLNPRWTEGWWYLGTIHYDANRYGEGQAAFKNLVGINPRLGPGWAMLGLCEFELQDYGNSHIHLQRARALGLGGEQEMTTVVRYHEALLLIHESEFESATQLLSSLVEHGVISNDIQVALGLALLRVPLFPRQVDPSKDALIHAAGGVAELMAMGNYDQADSAFQQVLHDYPQTPFVHYAYGAMLASLSRYDGAERQLREEIRVTPESALPYMQLAYVFLRLHRYAEALTLGQKAVELAPHSFAAHYLLGRTLLELNNVTEAVRELETARRLGPYSPEVRYNLARAYAKAHRQREANLERAEFARLNSLLQREQKPESGVAQSYRSSNERGNLEPHEVRNPAELPPK